VDVFLKIYETLTRPLSFASSLFLLLLTYPLLFSSPDFIERLGMTDFMEAHRWIFGLLFLIGLWWFLIAILLYFGNYLLKFIKRKWSEHLLHKRLKRLTVDERDILRPYVSSELRTQVFLHAQVATAHALEVDGILYQPTVPIDSIAPAVAFCIKETALAYLTAHPNLVAHTVPAPQH
jgi:hypothetical protein